MADEPEDPEVEEPEEAEDDDSCLYDGEAFFLTGRRDICERYGLVGLVSREGFVFALKVGEGEVLLSDVLKRKDGKVATMQAVKK